MKLYEYQAKRLFSEYSIPVPGGRVAFSAVEAEGAIESLGLPVVVKAQVLTGGRGKAGGIKLAGSKDEAMHAVRSLLGGGLKGVAVKSVLIEETIRYRRELYCSISVARASKSLVAMLSPEGGVEIEEVAEDPGKVLRQTLDVEGGVTGEQLRRGASFLRMEGDLQEKELSDILSNLFRLVIEKDCSLAEINPLFVDEKSLLVAGDAKVVLDDNALFRHPDFKAFADQDATDPLEVEAKKKGLSYVKMDGRIGCIVNGAGLAMATMDVIKLYGGAPANFLDVGGASKSEQVSEALRIVTSSGEVDVVLINIFGGIVRCDRVAAGILEAMRELDLSTPIVVRLEGTNSREAREMLEGTDLIMETSMARAAKRTVEISRRREK